MHYVYIIASDSTDKWYYGYTERIEERIIEHNYNHTHFTGGKGRWRLIFKRGFENKTEALQFEKELKKLRNKNYIKKQYAQYFV
jgi:putative endonuclease